MKRVSQIVFCLILSISALYGDVHEEIRAFLPTGAELYEKHLYFNRNFLRHDLQSFLCHNAKKAHEEGGEKLEYWTEVIHFLDGFNYEIDDDLEDLSANEKLNLSRAKNLLSGVERKLDLSLTRLNYAVDGLQGKAKELADLLTSGFGTFYRLDIYISAWFNSPIIYLAYDEANKHELVGCMWVIPSTVIIEEAGETKRVKVWCPRSVCCRSELVGMGIGQKLLNSLKTDPEIRYVAIETANDNTRAQKFYLALGYHLGDAPNAHINVLEKKNTTWFYGVHCNGQVLPFSVIGK